MGNQQKVTDARPVGPHVHHAFTARLIGDPNGFGTVILMSIGTIDELLSHPRRLVTMRTVHNFRDLGGYPTGSNEVTRWGLLFRADGLQRLQGDDLEVVRALGLRTVVDLRSQTELDERGSFPRHELEVEFAHHPIVDRTWDQEDDVIGDRTDHDFLVHAYTVMLAEGARRFGEAIEQLAKPGALPAVFHCAAGKDRTGLLAALLLGALGVPREVILGDYGLTRAGMVRMRAWAEQEFPEMVERMAETPSAYFAALPEALGEVLDGVVARHGSIRELVRAIGVSDDALASLGAQLLQPLT